MTPAVFMPPAAASSDRTSVDVPPIDNENPYAAPQMIEHRAPRESFIPVIGLALGIAVWVMFAVSLVLPAADPLPGWGPNPGRGFPGYLCAIVFWPCWLSNLLMATLPVWFIATAIRPFPRWATRLILWLLILSGIGVSVLGLGLIKMLGYWLWVASFFLAALAWGMISSSQSKAPSTMELTSLLRN